MSAATDTTQTIIEGVGDEVVVFFGISLLIILLVIAWSSTSVTEHGVFRAAVFVIERRRRRSDNETVITGTLPSASASVTRNSLTDIPIVEHVNDSRLQDTAEPSDNTSVLTNANCGNDNDPTSTLSPNRNSECHSEVTQQHKETAANSITDEITVDNSSAVEQTTNTTSDRQIKVRLKFLNDTQKLVEASLADQLGHFKQRYFGEELENNKIVKLIFNGQLLRSDQETLLHYGLFDNCVVHCHITSNMSPAPPPAFAPQVELDLSRLMLPLFGLILGLIWCCRIQYRQYFNATSTFALLCITGLFVVSVVALCMPSRTTSRANPLLDGSNSQLIN